MNPKVSFIVPCYMLAHLLSECVHSILAQSYQDYEILIMDDCSPDNSPEVARSLAERDTRVSHIRNEPNLGHLANYNKAINLARGEYIWLISADDYLRKSYVLQRFVDLMDAHPNIGYVFCPTMRIENGKETGLMLFTAPEAHDTIFKGHDFLQRFLLEADCVPAPAAMARKKCYTELSLFPLDLPYSGDWYLWSLFALYSDVGYFAEPMVYRRFHADNISKFFYKEAAAVFFANNLAVPTRIRERAEREGCIDIVKSCRLAFVIEYLRQMKPPRPGDPIQTQLTLEEFEQSLRGRAGGPREEAEVRAHVFSGMGDHYYEVHDFARSLLYYRLALNQDQLLLRVRLKYLFGRMGSTGMVFRESLSALRRLIRRIPWSRT